MSTTPLTTNARPELFAFESDFVATLRCIPMAVRMKLDLCGIKLSLRQWSRFTLADRERLLCADCEAEAEIAAYREVLQALIRTRAGEEAVPLAVDIAPAWRDDRTVPVAVLRDAQRNNLAPPTPTQWAALSPLRRFTLIKLTRQGHDNVNFAPAMREFGIA